MKTLLLSLKEALVELISATEGRGPSCTRLVYLINGVGALFCAVFSTLAGAIVYCYRGDASVTYWGGVATMWTATLGFGTLAKKHQANVTKAIKTAQYGGGQLQGAAASGD